MIYQHYIKKCTGHMNNGNFNLINEIVTNDVFGHFIEDEVKSRLNKNDEHYIALSNMIEISLLSTKLLEQSSIISLDAFEYASKHAPKKTYNPFSQDYGVNQVARLRDKLDSMRSIVLPLLTGRHRYRDFLCHISQESDEIIMAKITAIVSDSDVVNGFMEYRADYIKILNRLIALDSQMTVSFDHNEEKLARFNQRWGEIHTIITCDFPHAEAMKCSGLTTGRNSFARSLSGFFSLDRKSHQEDLMDRMQDKLTIILGPKQPEQPLLNMEL